MKLDVATVLACTALAVADPFYNSPKPYEQTFLDNYNVLKYTSWLGPFSQRRGVGINRDPPAGCKVDQVIMLHRHAERYPDPSSAKPMDAVWAKVEKKKGKLTGSLEFANYWKPYTDAKDGLIAQETTFGPYAGLLDAYSRGALYRERYGDIYDPESILPIFTSGYERITETGRWFGRGFLGYNYTELAAIQIIPETPEQGANSLVPACNTKNATNCQVPSAKDRTEWPDTAPWVYEEFQSAAKRLNKENGLNLTASDIPNLMSIPAFELNVRGSSPWISVFTSEEWIAFEYLQSAYYYCYAGPGSPTTVPTGALYLNATRLLLNQGPEEALPLYFNFAHDTDITPIVSILGFASPEKYDPTKVHFNPLWDVADITPQGAHLVLERLVCDSDEAADVEAALDSHYPLAFNATNGTATYASNYTYPNTTLQSGLVHKRYNGTTTMLHNATGSNSTVPKKGTENIYVRVVLNEAVAPLPECNDGPGKSCKLSDYNKLLQTKIGNVSYVKECDVPSKYPQTLDFFWTWNATSELDADTDPIPYQAALLNSTGGVIPDQ